MIVYDDLEPSEKIKVYDKGITLNGNPQTERREGLSDAGRLPHRRHVGAAARHDRGAQRRAPAVRRLHRAATRRRLTDGQAGLRVVRILEAATESMAERGRVDRARASEVRRMIPFLDLKAQYHEHQARDRRAPCSRVLDSDAVRPRRRGRGLRARVRRLLRRQARDRRQLRHQRAAPRAARRRRRARATR